MKPILPKHDFVQIVLQAIAVFEFERIVVLARHSGQVTPVHPHFSGAVFSVAQLELIRVAKADFIVVAEGSRIHLLNCATGQVMVANELRETFIKGRFGEVEWQPVDVSSPDRLDWSQLVLATRLSG